MVNRIFQYHNISESRDHWIMQFESFHCLSNHADHGLYRENMIAEVQNKLFFFSLNLNLGFRLARPDDSWDLVARSCDRD